MHGETVKHPRFTMKV